jgi:AraC family transcriptional regulator of adaptative response / methylphosphotriester-DNA alkyltransferase methyltransferase
MAGAARRLTTVATRRVLFEEAVAVIELEHPHELTLDSVARRLFTSRRQLQRAFAEAGATGFREHLRRVRMRRAAELLRAGQSVREVAIAVGYRQPAQFAKAFQREHGTAPSRVQTTRALARVHADVGLDA